MRYTNTILGSKARKAVLDGVNAIVNPVARTLGPEGKNALLYRTFNRGNRITNDGYTVAECQEPKDQFVRMASQTFKESCKRTNEKVGDGTTSTIVIGGKLYNDAYSLLSEGQSEFISKKGKTSVISLKRKILESAQKVEERIKKVAKKIETLEDLEHIATVSVEDEKLGKVIAKMAWDVGVDGFIDTVEGYKGEIETEVIKGMRFPAKVAAKVFINNPNRYEMVAKDCSVLITNYALDNAAEVAITFQGLNQKTAKIIVIAPSFSDNVLINMLNASKQGFSLYPVAVPSLRTEQFDDLAVYCNAVFIDKNKGKSLRNVKFEDLGFLGKLIVKDTDSKEDAVATEGKGTREIIGNVDENNKNKENGELVMTSPIKERIAILKAQIQETKQDQFKKVLERRIASIASSVGVIKVGDSTEASSLYRKLKIEDAVYACKAALRGGYVKGGGLCLKEIADTLPDDDILKNALLAPYEAIQASVENGLVIGDNIIDPAEVVYYEVEHATSVVANLITVEIITPEMEDPIHGEGELAIARMLGELNLTLRKQYGMIKENEDEAERDRMNSLTKGLTFDEYQNQENG